MPDSRRQVTGAGKLFHPGVPPNFDEPRSWSQTAPDGTPWPYEDTPRGVNASTECNNTGLAFKDGTVVTCLLAY